jgi:hypothetical protein
LAGERPSLSSRKSSHLKWFAINYSHHPLRVGKAQIRDVVEKRGNVARLLKAAGRYMSGTSALILFIAFADSMLASEALTGRLLDQYCLSNVAGISR